ncbi:MAG: CoA transferase [Chloroflexi bacterium]|nr:CoA transferase [Chloroflexota bacterium]
MAVQTESLAGIRVIDFTWMGAGPLATAGLAYLGAEVIKIESMKRLDGTRLRHEGGITASSVNASQRFNDINLNKLSITLNLRKPEAVEILKRLARVSDVAAENFRAGVINRLGLGYDVLSRERPDIIMLSSSASGQTGPESGHAGYASIFGAMAGLSHMTGYIDGPPMEMRLPMDFISAGAAAFAILAALNYRQRTGEGQFLDLSSREVIACLIGDVLLDAAVNGHNPSRVGNQDEIMAPHNCYPCKGEDRWVSIAVGDDSEWTAFCRAIGNPAWTAQARFSDQLSRWKNQEALDELVGRWTRKYAAHEVMDILQRAGVAAAPSFSADMVYNDPHLKARKCVVQVKHPEIGKQKVLAPPYKMSATPPRVKRHGPLLGEHNEYILCEVLGMGKRELARLIEEEVVV